MLRADPRTHAIGPGTHRLTRLPRLATIDDEKTFSRSVNRPMELRYTVHSPCARQARLSAREPGRVHQVMLASTSLRTGDPAFWAGHPMAKVPVWVQGATIAQEMVKVARGLDVRGDPVYALHRHHPRSGFAGAAFRRHHALRLKASASSLVGASAGATVHAGKPAGADRLTQRPR